MAHVKLKLSEGALNHLIANTAETESLSESASTLLSVNAMFNEAYYYFDTYRSTSSKTTLRFEDGATRTYNGTITTIGQDYYYEYGTALANSVILAIPSGVRESITGSLNYSYITDNHDYLEINYQGGTIKDYRVDIFGKSRDAEYGNITAGLAGEINSTAYGILSGTLTKLYSTAQKIEKSNLIEGTFNISGSIVGGVQVSGTLSKFRTDFHDKSFFEIQDSRYLDSHSTINIQTLRQQDFWSGDDTFEIELSNKATQTLRINSGDGNDHLTLKGGRGLLVVDAGNGDDVIRLLDRDPVIKGGAGIDTVETAFSYSIETLGDIENLTLYGSKKADATGNSLNNILHGNSAANILDGRTGADQMFGGAGNDIYIVDNIGDETIELANQGIDTVKAWLSWTLGEHLENLELLGSAHIDATGNSAANKITGNAGNNILDGAGGIDTLIGGQGDDTYIVDLALKGQGNTAVVVLEDKISELANQGIDTLQVRGEFALSQATTLRLANNLENLDASATGLTRLNLTGNAADNIIIGNNADNIIIGGIGADTMTGGGGKDTFRFTSLKELGLAERQDVIMDFTRSEDLLDFKALKGYSFVGEEAFSGVKQLRYETDGSDLILYGNAGGDQQPEFSIKLVGITNLSAADLLLA